MDEQHTVPIPEAAGPGETQVMPEVTARPATGTAPPTAPPPGQPPAGAPTPPSDGGGDKRGMTLLIVIVIAILLLGACAAAYILQKREADDLQTQLDEAQAQLDESDEDETDQDDAADPVADDEDIDDVADEPAEDDDGDAADDDSDEPVADEDDGQHIGIVTDIYNVEQSRWIEIDFIQFLTGQAAADAAAAAGDESPPPNDYYILNENPRLRDFNVREGLRVKMWTWNMETDGITEQEIPFDIWWDEIEMHGVDRYLFSPYWIEVDNGTVIEIEEQFLP